MPNKLLKSEAKSCLQVLFALLGIQPDEHRIDMSELFQTKEVDIGKYLVLYPVPMEGYYWITPRQRDLRTFLVPAGTVIFARFHKNNRTVDANFDWKNRDIVVTMSDQNFNEASARMHRLPSPPFEGSLGETVKEIHKFYGKK